MFKRSLLFSFLVACASADDIPDASVPDAPPGPHIEITPDMPVTRDDLVATVVNGTSLLSYRWFQDGTRRDEFTNGAVGHAATGRGQVWRVELVDDKDTVLASDSVTIANSPPTPFTVAVSPSAPVAGSKLQCGLATPTFDEDGDPIQYTAEWVENDVPFTATTTTDYPNDTVAPSATQGADVFRCRITASDGVTTTLAESAPVTIVCVTGGMQRFDVNGTGSTGTLQSFVVPAGVCSIRIEAAGAMGAGANTNGAVIAGTFAVNPGQTFKILVGQMPTILAGGGGTFVVDPVNTPFLIAGGGGSNFGGTQNAAESSGQAGTAGGTFGAAPRADNGAGGKIIAGSNASGGGGLLERGDGLAPGKSFITGGTGGGPAPNETRIGGYGGGGARAGLWGEGGGGGYSGGSCGDTFNGSTGTWVGCGGGGSYNAGTEPSNTAGMNAGQGYVIITW